MFLACRNVTSKTSWKQKLKEHVQYKNRSNFDVHYFSGTDKIRMGPWVMSLQMCTSVGNGPSETKGKDSI